MSSVQPPLSRDTWRKDDQVNQGGLDVHCPTWSSWQTLVKAEICFAILMILLIAKSVRLITLGKNWFHLMERIFTWLDLARWCTSGNRRRHATKDIQTDRKVSERWRKIATLLGQLVRQVSVMRCRVHWAWGCWWNSESFHCIPTGRKCSKTVK